MLEEEEEEEELIAVALEQCSALAWPCGREEIAEMAKSYFDSMKKQTVFRNNLPGADWMITYII